MTSCACRTRAATPEVAQALIREMAWYDTYLERSGVDRSANTTPGNKAGGLSNIVEKAMGSIVKSGSAPISGVLAPGEKLRQKGLIRLMLDVASGRKKTWAEQWKLNNALVLFNPAPIT